MLFKVINDICIPQILASFIFMYKTLIKNIYLRHEERDPFIIDFSFILVGDNIWKMFHFLCNRWRHNTIITSHLNWMKVKNIIRFTCLSNNMRVISKFTFNHYEIFMITTCNIHSNRHFKNIVLLTGQTRISTSQNTAISYKIADDLN